MTTAILDSDVNQPYDFGVVRWNSKEYALTALGSQEGQAAVADLENFAGAGVDMELGEVNRPTEMAADRRDSLEKI